MKAPLRAGRRPVKRIDPNMFRELVKDGRVWNALGRVTRPDDSAAWDDYYEVHTEGLQIVDITVEVELVPSRVTVTARMGGWGKLAGVVQIPAVGDEVIVAIPDGELSFMPTIIGLLGRPGNLRTGPGGGSSSKTPGDDSNPEAEGGELGDGSPPPHVDTGILPIAPIVMIWGQQVFVHNGQNAPEPLAKLSDVDAVEAHVQAVVTYINTDLELTVVGGGGGLAKGATAAALLDTPDDATTEGTSTLKAT